jgi:hypothetical protein
MEAHNLQGGSGGCFGLPQHGRDLQRDGCSCSSTYQQDDDGVLPYLTAGRLLTRHSVCRVTGVNAGYLHMEASRRQD